MKRKLNSRDLTLTPKVRHNAYSREFTRELSAFVEDMANSFEYWAMAGLNKSGVLTYDAPTPAKALKAALQELITRWESKSRVIAPKLTDRQLNRLLSYINGRYKPLLGKGTSTMTKRLKDVVKARYNENTALISSIPQDLLKRYESTLYDAVTGGDAYSVKKRLAVIKGITLRQAARIAGDQTAKAIEAFSMARQEELGLEYYYWETAHDERVSTGYGGHKHLNGLIFRYDKPEAVVDSYGNVGHPAQRVNCRCTSRGVYLKPGQIVKKTRNGYEIIGL